MLHWRRNNYGEGSICNCDVTLCPKPLNIIKSFSSMSSNLIYMMKGTDIVRERSHIALRHSMVEGRKYHQGHCKLSVAIVVFQWNDGYQTLDKVIILWDQMSHNEAKDSTEYFLQITFDVSIRTAAGNFISELPSSKGYGYFTQLLVLIWFSVLTVNHGLPFSV